MKKPFDRSKDVRGDLALFIPERTRLDNPTLIRKLKTAKPQTAYTLTPGKGFKKKKTKEVFFRMINDKGIEQHSHGWMRYNAKKKLAEVTTWG